MTKPISTRVHGILDWMTAGFMHTLPRVMGWSKDVTQLLDAASVAAVGNSAVTKYEYGMVRVMPMKAHLAIDALCGGALIGAALLMDDEDPEVRATVAGIGLFELAAALLTKTQPPAYDPIDPVGGATPTGVGARDMFASRGHDASMPTAGGTAIRGQLTGL